MDIPLLKHPDFIAKSAPADSGDQNRKVLSSIFFVSLGFMSSAGKALHQKIPTTKPISSYARSFYCK